MPTNTKEDILDIHYNSGPPEKEPIPLVNRCCRNCEEGYRCRWVELAEKYPSQK